MPARVAISVVMPTFNQARFLRPAVESVLSQRWRDLELLVVDDGSTDATPAVLESLVLETQDSRLRVVRHARNQGASAALNTGFALAAGDYLTWLASDNRYRPTCLERLLQALLDHPDCDLAYASFVNVDEDGGLLDCVCLEPYWPGLLQVHPGAVGMAFLYARRLLEAVGEYRDLVGNDLDFWLRAARAHRFVFVPEVLGENRKHPAMQTVVHRERLATEVARLLEAERAHTPAPTPLPPLLERVHGLRRAAQQCLRAVTLALPETATGRPLVVADAGETGALLAAMLQAQGLPAQARAPQTLEPGDLVLALTATEALALRRRGCTVLGAVQDTGGGEGEGWGMDF